MLAAFACVPEAHNDAQPDEKKRAVAVQLRRVPKPNLAGLPPGTVLIKSVATSICGSDLFGSCRKTGRRPTKLFKAMMEVEPRCCGVSGHEVIGTFVEIIEEEAPPSSSSSSSGHADDTDSRGRLRVGQRVLAMSSSYILRVDTVRTVFERETGMAASVLPEQGSFAEYFISHSCACIPIPTSSTTDDSPLPSGSSFDPLWFVLAQPLGTIIHACKKLGSVMGKNVAVVGQGPNGLIMTQMLAGMGARRVIALDLLEERLARSKRCKATHAILCCSNKSPDGVDDDNIKRRVREITEGRMCDVVAEMVGHQGRTLDLCASLTKNDGTVLLFGLPAEEGEAGDDGCFSIRSDDFTRNVRYVCAHSPTMDCFELAVELLEQGRMFDPAPLVTHYVPFEKFPEAYDMANNYADGVVKIIVTF